MSSSRKAKLRSQVEMNRSQACQVLGVVASPPRNPINPPQTEPRCYSALRYQISMLRLMQPSLRRDSLPFFRGTIIPTYGTHYAPHVLRFLYPVIDSS